MVSSMSIRLVCGCASLPKAPSISRREFLAKWTERLRSHIPRDGWGREDIIHTTLRELPYPALVHATFEIEPHLMDPYDMETVLEVLSPFTPFDQDLRAILSPEE